MDIYLQSLKSKGFQILEDWTKFIRGIEQQMLNRFSPVKSFNDDYWCSMVEEWTPFIEDVDEIKFKWQTVTHNLFSTMIDKVFSSSFSDLHISTKNFKSSIIEYNDGHIGEHSDRTTLTFLYTSDDGLEIYDNGWIIIPGKTGVVHLGDYGSKELNINPVLHRVRHNSKKYSFAYFTVPSNIDYPWKEYSTEIDYV